MNEETLQKMLDESYNDSREEGLRAMLKEFYNRRMAATVVFVWTFGIACAGMAVWCAVAFFGTAETKSQIMYAAGFLMFVMWLGQIKVFAWQMIHRNSIKREIKRLELCIAQLSAGNAAKEEA